MDCFIEFVLVVVCEVLIQVGWLLVFVVEQECIVMVIVIGIGGFSEIVNVVYIIDECGLCCFLLFIIFFFLVNLVVGYVFIVYGFWGFIGVLVIVCVVGVQVIGDVVWMICSGEVDIVFCGGVEVVIYCVSLVGFVVVRVFFSVFNDQLEVVFCFFDCDCDGFVMGEGVGFIVIELLEYVLVCGVMLLVELVGYGISVDVYYLIVGLEDGNGVCWVMEIVICQVGVIVDEIDYINVYVILMQVGDKGELVVIKMLFGVYLVVIILMKFVIGYLLGVVGGIEVIFIIQVLCDQVVLLMLNLYYFDEEVVGFNLVVLQVCLQKMCYVLLNGFGFGGVNVSLLLKCWE